MNICMFSAGLFVLRGLLALAFAMVLFAFMKDGASPALTGGRGLPDPDGRKRLWSLPELVNTLCGFPDPNSCMLLWILMELIYSLCSKMKS